MPEAMKWFTDKKGQASFWLVAEMCNDTLIFFVNNYWLINKNRRSKTFYKKERGSRRESEKESEREKEHKHADMNRMR